MKREVQEPTERPDGFGGKEGRRLDHPAFGMISAARVSGGITLYGSDFVHQNFVMVRINRSYLMRDLYRDWPGGGGEIVEVAMSEAQWATFVSSLNMGNGVSCTLRFVKDEGLMPDIPVRTEEAEARRDFDQKAKDMGAKVQRTIAQIRDGIGSRLSGKVKDELLEDLDRLKRDLMDSLPFLAKSFEEHLETTVESAKIDVDAFIHAAIQRAGLATLGGEAPLSLPARRDLIGGPDIGDDA